MIETREQAILTAVDFLSNPRVQKSSLVQKRNFLVSKGLNDDEIQLAFEKAGIFTKLSDLDKNQNENETRIQINSTATSSGLQKASLFERLKSLAGSFALVSGIVYGVYLFYKRYVEAFLFGRKKKTDKIDDLAKTTKAINGELMKFRDEISKQKQMQESNHKLIQTSLQTLKSEIETVKGMLLNKKQFAAPSSMTIPSWQLTKKKDHTNNDDAHSANSSENDTEVIPEDSSSRESREHEKRSPANSDSSLEIM